MSVNANEPDCSNSRLKTPGCRHAVDSVATALRERRPGEIVEIAHMEIAQPSIAEGIARCVAAGAGKIVLHPYFLGPGRHTQESIPALVAGASAQHPGLEIRIGQPLGLHEGVIDAVLDRIDEAG